MIGLIAPFQMLEYLDRLKVVKETSQEYHCLCPVCGDGGFKVNKKNGSYQAFKCGCEVKDIREAVNPWSEVTVTKKDSKRRQVNRGTIKLARLDSPAEGIPSPESKTIPEWLQSQGVPPEATQTRYWYSKTQWVSRFEWINADGSKEKTIRQGHIKSNGLIQWKKGSKDWRAYRLSEAVKYCQDKWVLAVEGEGCVEAARAGAIAEGLAKPIAGITWQGSNWNEKAIANDVTKLIEAGAAGIVYFPDHDEAGAKKAELVKSACQSVNLPCLILSPIDVWAEMPHKGDLTDFAQAHPNLKSSELIKKLESAVAIAYKRQEQEKSEAEEQEKLASLPNWSQSDIADWLAEKYQGQLAWNVDEQEWYRYGSITEGIYSRESTELIGQLVKSQVKAIASEIGKASKKRRDSPADGFHGQAAPRPSAGDCRKKPSYTISFINGVTALLKLDLAVRRWNEAKGLLPLLNGVLDLKTRKLLPHSPENKLTWCLPYKYNVLATCEPIQEWLLSTCGGDRAVVELMRAYLLGILTGRTDWQKYLELIGAGGTGKSTFTRLATALVGQENVHTTTLNKLEGEKFETASIAGKRLVIINDSERYAGGVTKLKNLTGQDTLPYEVKYQQSKGGFTPNALVMVSTNEVIQSSDYTSGLARRRISVPMRNLIESDRQKNLIEYQDGEMVGEFVPHIPGLLNWVLAMDETEATRIVKNYEAAVPSLLEMKAQTLVETNPIADWLDHKVVYEATAQTNVGVAKRNKDHNCDQWYLNTNKWLYASYAEHCHDTGNRALSLRRFVNLLSDLAKNQLGLDIERERDRYGSYFVGLKIRTEEDDKPPMITGEPKCDRFPGFKSAPPTARFPRHVAGASRQGLPVTAERGHNIQAPSQSNPNIIHRVWTMLIDKVTTAIDQIIDDSDLGSELETETKEEDSISLEQKSDSKVQNDREICVGDRVTISDCPGHWSWASPFTVRAIEGENVKLEMVNELIEIGRLQKCQK